MRGQKSVRRVILAMAVLLWFAGAEIAHAQGGCMSFGEARQAGLFARYKLRPAAQVKNAVEGRTGGKVVSVLICEPGPTYKLTVLQPRGNVSTVMEPAR